MRQAMIDTETLGVKPGCIVLSIGMVVFDESNILDQYWVNIDPLDAEKQGLKVEASTALWWFDQSDEARKQITQRASHPLRKALEDFRGRFNWSEIDRIWVNGASFDFPILKAAFEAAGLGSLPWPYYKEMDYRTFKNQFSTEDYKAHLVKPTIAHDAMADARAQALTMMNLQGSVNAGGVKWAA